VSAVQPETFSPRNITVLGGLLLLAIFIGEVLIGPNHGDETLAEEIDTLEDIAMRIQPVVTLDDILSGTSIGGGGATVVAAAAPDTSSMTPEQLYQGACLACHTTGAAGAPKIGDAADWGARIAKGVDGLTSSAIAGIGAMPARGGSQYDDAQIHAVVEYILENSQ
jgi:cytochrome c5